MGDKTRQRQAPHQANSEGSGHVARAVKKASALAEGPMGKQREQLVSLMKCFGVDERDALQFERGLGPEKIRLAIEVMEQSPKAFKAVLETMGADAEQKGFGIDFVLSPMLYACNTVQDFEYGHGLLASGIISPIPGPFSSLLQVLFTKGMEERPAWIEAVQQCSKALGGKSGFYPIEYLDNVMPLLLLAHGKSLEEFKAWEAKASEILFKIRDFTRQGSDTDSTNGYLVRDMLAKSRTLKDMDEWFALLCKCFDFKEVQELERKLNRHKIPTAREYIFSGLLEYPSPKALKIAMASGEVIPHAESCVQKVMSSVKKDRRQMREFRRNLGIR